MIIIAENYIYKHNFKVRFSDTDTYGIVHHKNYYDFFDDARFHFAKDAFGYNQDSKIKFIVAESHCIYKNALKFSLDFYTILLNCKIINNVKLHFDETIKSLDMKKTYAKGTIVQVLTDENDKLLLEIPKSIREKLESFQSGSNFNGSKF